MAVGLRSTLRGGLAGAAAAEVWAAQQPLDRRVFGVPYDDPLLLGTLVTSGRGAIPVGQLLHALTGAALGAVYANVAPGLPGPAPVRGALFGLAEHVATWPAVALLPRLHPRGAALPRLWGSRAAFAQSAWRHVLFGTVLGELERRLNRSGGGGPIDPAAAASNGHGSPEHLAMAGPA